MSVWMHYYHNRCCESHTLKLQIAGLKQIISSLKHWSNWNITPSQTMSGYVHGVRDCCASAELYMQAYKNENQTCYSLEAIRGT